MKFAGSGRGVHACLSPWATLIVRALSCRTSFEPSLISRQVYCFIPEKVLTVA